MAMKRAMVKVTRKLKPTKRRDGLFENLVRTGERVIGSQIFKDSTINRLEMERIFTLT